MKRAFRLFRSILILLFGILFFELAGALPLLKSNESKVCSSLQLDIEASSLKQIGVEFRRYGWFGTKIYKACSYSVEAPKSWEQVSKLDTPFYIQLEYLYSVGKEDLKEAWEKSLKGQCADQCAQMSSELARFLSALEPIEKQHRFEYFFQKNSVRVYHEGKLEFSSMDSSFIVVLLSTFVGTSPPTEELKKALLGAD